MANVNGHLTVSIVDELQSRAPVIIYFSIPDGASIAEAGTELAATVAALNDCTGGKIVGAELSLEVALPTPNDATGFQLNDSVGLSFPVPSTHRQYPLAIPARAAATVSGGLPVMTDGQPLDIFADILEAAMTASGTTAGHYTTDGYAPLGAVARGYLPRRKFARDLPAKGRRAGL